MTEDVLKDLKEALVVVWWFNGIVKSNPGQWKLVCWPNLLKSLEEKLEHPDLSKDDQQLYEPHSSLGLLSNTNFT